MNYKDAATAKKTKTRRPKHGKRIVGFEEKVQCKCPSDIYPLAQAPNNGIAQASDNSKTLPVLAKHQSPLKAGAPLQHPKSRSSTFQACADQSGQNFHDPSESDMLSALDRVALQMIEAAKER